MEYTTFSPELLELADKADEALRPIFKAVDEISFCNTSKVLHAFREHRVDATMFDGTSGYGYDDKGRDTLERIWADVMGTESALVRHNIVSGTHALTIGLFGLLRPGDTLLAVTGKPYDTLDGIIGINGIGAGQGTLADYGIKYSEVQLPIVNGKVDGDRWYEDITAALKADKSIKVVFLQRSKGYCDRPTLSAAEISGVTALVRGISDAFVMVDNCYGEFTEKHEPVCDLMAGSLIKNPGGGMAESGGYFAGTQKAVELVSYRLTAPGIGAECGASLGQNKNLIKGLFYAPHSTAQAIKTMHFAAYMLEQLGYETSPRWDEERYDIIQTIRLGSAEKLCAFCQGIQAGSPVDAYVTPEPWAMPGYQDEVIMAAGTFTQGASLELSADGPVREPFIVYMQGGLTYESGRYGVLTALQKMKSM